MHHIKLNERNHTIKSSYIGPFNEPLYQIIHNIKKYNITNLTHNFIYVQMSWAETLPACSYKHKIR